MTNVENLWTKKRKRRLEIDTEIIPVLLREFIDSEGSIKLAVDKLFATTEGVISAAVFLVFEQKLILISNNGSCYFGEANGGFYFASEKFPLQQIGAGNIEPVVGCKELKIAETWSQIDEIEDFDNSFGSVRVPTLAKGIGQEKLLKYPTMSAVRCTNCILPETMPFIEFDEKGVCNYCRSYQTRNDSKPLHLLKELIAPYRRQGEVDCILPFSGGRDSCMAMHLVCNELGMKPIAYTYDWGMITDLGRRNISRFCANFGVENIIVAADIRKKRENISKNLRAWLQHPHLGMLNLLTAGDKHFFQHIEIVKRQVGVSLNLWGINPLEVTHFKTGFLGMQPDFGSSTVYQNGVTKQLIYQAKRLGACFRNPAYLNSSIFDTLSGEYWRSVNKKKDYFHVYDFYKWDEAEIDNTLSRYNWEKAVDTNSTWRIGDGTAAFYNYVYRTMAGFTEHDTFRSNQIREGEMSRNTALSLIEDENTPRYENIRWYLDVLGLPFDEVISAINSAPRLY